MLTAGVTADFTNLRALGQGATSEVFEAESARGAVLLKVANKDHADTLRREAVTLFTARGPDTLGLIETCTLELATTTATHAPRGRPTLVLEHRRGETLRQLFERSAPIDPIAVARDLARGLAHLHQGDVAHGDVKPENIIVDARGAFLIDFGLAGPASAPTPRGATLRYLPRKSSLGSARSRDLYALGLTLFEIAHVEARNTRDVASLAEASIGASGIPGALEDVIFGLLIEDPNARPRARWIASFLDGRPDEDPTRRLAHARTTFLSLFPALLDGPTVDAASVHDPHPWLAEAWSFSAELARTFGEKGRPSKTALDLADRRELLARLFG